MNIVIETVLFVLRLTLGMGLCGLVFQDKYLLPWAIPMIIVGGIGLYISWRRGNRRANA